MADRKLFVAIHDYQSGSVRVRVFASSKSEVTNLLQPPSWDVYEDADSKRPRLEDESRLDTSDVDNPSKLLKSLIYIQARQREGKLSFTYKVISAAGTEYRNIWAKSQREIEDRFPQLESMMFIGMGPEILGQTGTSDIDVPDEFLMRHSR